jgi:heme-degrading monooxygenase HmoA
MSITRLIYITIDPSETDRAMQVWKKECAPLMIQQKGCISERLLRSRDAHEFISCSEWESEVDIEHTRGLKGAKAQVRLYEAVT